MTATIRIVHNLARSGGTIFARCLGCMDSVALLSEIHPWTVGIFGATQQASEWHGLQVHPGQSFVANVGALANAAAEGGRALVLRGWDHVDVMPCPHNGWVPSMHSELTDTLAGRFEVRRLALVREPLAMWASLRRHWAKATQPRYGDVSLADFLRGYRVYAEMACDLPIVRYEDFCRDPGGTLVEACDALGLRFDAGWPGKWRHYHKVTGDIANQGGRMDIAMPAPVRNLEIEALAAGNADYRVASALLGY